MTDLTAVVTGASRGFGLAIANALRSAATTVVGISRSDGGDATDPGLAARVLAEHKPSVVVLNAGAIPPMGPLDDLTWDEFSRTWNVDTRHVFEWVRAALRLPLPPGSRILAMSSGAAINGSPVSGGYAGAKATIKFICAYAREESDRRGLGLHFTALQPRLTPLTALGEAGAAAYAQRLGIDVPAFVAKLGPLMPPAELAAHVVRLATDPEPPAVWQP
jgi:NAD(P)-dependent dehydrogenase (short-subunit alcohol dehydrogenase family)